MLERIEFRKQVEAQTRTALIKKVEDARWAAYFAQEHLTSDPVVKKAVSDATLHMMCIILDLPYGVHPSRESLMHSAEQIGAIPEQKKGETPSA